MKKGKTMFFLIICILSFMYHVKADEIDEASSSNNIFGPFIDDISGKLHVDSYVIMAVLAVIVIIVAIIIASVIIKKILYEPFKNKNVLGSNISSRKIKSLDPSLNPEEFKKFTSESFIMLSSSFSNFRYDILRQKMSEQLYQDKVTELESYKKRNLKNIISNVIPIYCQINNIQMLGDTEKVDVIYTAQYKDYLVAQSDPDVIVSGSKRDTQERTFLLTFLKKELNITCTKCGGEVQNDICLYCRAEQKEKESGWILDKMKLLKQKTIGK